MNNLLQIPHKVHRIRHVVLYNKAFWKQEKTLFCAAPLLLLFLLCARLLLQRFLLLRHLFVPQPLKCLGTPSGYSREGQRLGGDGGVVGCVCVCGGGGMKSWGVCGPDVWAFMRLGRGSGRGRQRSRGDMAVLNYPDQWRGGEEDGGAGVSRGIGV